MGDYALCKEIRLKLTPAKVSLLEIMRAWAKAHLNDIYSETLLTEANIRRYLTPQHTLVMMIVLSPCESQRFKTASGPQARPQRRKGKKPQGAKSAKRSSDYSLLPPIGQPPLLIFICPPKPSTPIPKVTISIPPTSAPKPTLLPTPSSKAGASEVVQEAPVAIEITQVPQVTVLLTTVPPPKLLHLCLHSSRQVM